MSKNFLQLDTPSPLPLIPYIISDSSEHPKAVSETVIPALDLSNDTALPRAIIDNVLRENYVRRISEAQRTAQAVTSKYFMPDGTFRIDRHHAIDDYASFRIVDANQHAKLGDRIRLFMDPAHLEELEAYEIFAHQSQELFPDVSFARDCLALVARTAGEVGIDETASDALPKITRKIELAQQSVRVVMAKTAVGQFVHNESLITLKSRKAGVLDYDELSPAEQQVVDTLTAHDPDDGRTADLMAARERLQSMVTDRPTLVTPVVESLYLTRDAL